jgi:ferredoxin-NADP reductase/DMSO/TMAO reductase YedYZ heme-binding membrane subunit/rubredoxin
MLGKILARINQLLLPVERLIKQYRRYIGYFLIFLAFCSLGLILSPETVKLTGEQSMNLLWFILFLPILARVIWLSLAQTLMPLRKELGILMGTLAFVHGTTYLLPDVTYVLDSTFWIQDGMLSYLAFGFFALVLSIPLTLTSSTWAMRKLGKSWKTLHRTVYLILIFTIIHVVLLKWYREFEVGPVLIMVAYFVAKGLEWKWIKLSKSKNTTYPKWQKWLCVPCGYIYDPILGDEEDGIPAGTEFSDIPDNWRCPVCGVSKADFIPFVDGQEIATHVARAVHAELINPTTLELIIETSENFPSKPGQFMSFLWHDDEWEFLRSYSIAAQVGKRFTFLIKLDEKGRGARILRHIGVDADIHIKWVFGNFLLQENKNPKVFIATGTGLAPIYRMITSLQSHVIPGLSRDPAQPGTTGFLPPQEWQKQGEQQKMSLYFTVATKAELFYVEKLRHITNLDLHIHTTREEVEWCEFWRVDVTTITATPDTEWYLCGSPKMVEEAKEKLAARGYERVYGEEFN